MTSYDAEFADLMQRVQQGSEEAARQLHENYGRFILAAVRKRLDQRLRSKFDSTDFVQDVWVSFFADVPDQYTFSSPKDLVAFLTRMAARKVAQTQRKRFQTEKYKIERETPLEELPRGPDALPAQQSTPSEILMGEERWLSFLQTLPPVYRMVFVRLRQGKTNAAIAEELNLDRRTVERVIARVTESYLSGEAS